MIRYIKFILPSRVILSQEVDFEQFLVSNTPHFVYAQAG
jgi:hypothetical protein